MSNLWTAAVSKLQRGRPFGAMAGTAHVPLLADEERASDDRLETKDLFEQEEDTIKIASPRTSTLSRQLMVKCIAAVGLLLLLVVAAPALPLTPDASLKLLGLKPTLSPLTTQRSPKPSHYVPVWHSDPLPGNQVVLELPFEQEDLDSHNVTNTILMMRKAVVEKSTREGFMNVRVVAAVYDLPFDRDFHLRWTSFWRIESGFGISASIPSDPSDPSSERVYGKLGFGAVYEQQFRFPDHLFVAKNETQGQANDASVPLRLEYKIRGKVLATVDLVLRQRQLPYSRFSICSKPLYGEAVPKQLVEWREHHRLLGFEAVHFSSRNAETELAIRKLNELTGGFDSFEHMPRFDRGGEERDVWDEYLTFGDCYLTYRQTSGFIGVWDLDEYAAPPSTKPWTSEYVQNYLTSEWPSWDSTPSYPEGRGHLHLPMTWVDRKRFGDLAPETLTAIDPALPAEDAQAIAALDQTAAKVVERHFSDYAKSIHRTDLTRGAGVHGGWNRRRDDHHFGIQWPDNVGLVIYHARKQQGWLRDEYIPYPLNESIVRHLRILVQRIREMKLNAVLDPTATRLLRL